MKKIELLLLIESSETGGAERVFFELVKNIDSNKISIHIGLFYKGWLFDELKKDGFKPSLLHIGKSGFDYKLVFSLFEYIRKNKIDVVCSHLFTANLYSSIVGKMLRVPVISVFHGAMDVGENDRFARMKFLLLNFFSSKMVFVSNHLKNFYFDKFKINLSKSITIYNGVSITPNIVLCEKQIRMRTYIDNKKFIVIAIGDIRKSKDYPTLLKACTILIKKIPGFKLLIAGTETELQKELIAMSNKLELSKQVVFLGYCEDVRTILRTCDAYVSSSLSEGFSLTVVEAMDAGIPVVATKSGGPEEIIINEQSGLLVPSRKPKLLANALFRVYSDGALRSIMSKNARNCAIKKFSLEMMVARYEELIFSLGGGDINEG